MLRIAYSVLQVTKYAIRSTQYLRLHLKQNTPSYFFSILKARSAWNLGILKSQGTPSLQVTWMAVL